MTVPKTKFIFFENKTSDGDSSIIEWTGSGPATLQISGTWGGATVTVLGSCDQGNTWTSPTQSVYEYTDDSIVEFQAGRILVKLTVSDASETTSLSAYLVPSE